MVKNPCYGCENRGCGCHANCNLYWEWKVLWDKERKVIREKKDTFKRVKYNPELKFKKK